MEQILRKLEAKHRLTKVLSSNLCARQRPKTNQLQRYQRENKKYVQQQPEIPMMAKLEAAIDVASRDRPTMTSFVSRIQQLGIDVRPYITEKGRKGISYRLGDFKVRGCKLHNGSFPKLISERGIYFDEVRDIPAIEAAYQGKYVEIDDKQSLSWEQIDLNYWLPQSLKALANAHSTKKDWEIPDQKQWNNLQKTLLARYGIPEHISAGLNEANLLSADETGEPIWHKRSLLGSKNSHFWFEVNDNNDSVKKLAIASSPIEAVSAYLVERLINRENSSCLYLSLDTSKQLTELDLTKFDAVVINSIDKQLVSDRVSNLVIQENTTSWQQSWLTHWNKVEKILSPQANKNSTSLQKQTNHSSKQLEL